MFNLSNKLLHPTNKRGVKSLTDKNYHPLMKIPINQFFHLLQIITENQSYCSSTKSRP